jgi:hypothetical protein
MNDDKVITALFFDQYKLKIYTQGNGTVEVNLINTGEFELTAQPSEGWVFEEWREDLIGNINPATLSKDRDKLVTAIFTRIPFKLTTMITGGRGKIEPKEGTYYEITVVNLTATPYPGYRIKSWTGTDDDSITDNTNEVTMDSDRLVTVEFTQLSNVDRDFLPDKEEKGPYGNNIFYDGNGDGIEDYKQANVVSMHIYNSRHYISIESEDSTQISYVEVIDPNLIQEEPPLGIDFELGLLSFALTVPNPGESSALRLYLPSGMRLNTYLKFGPTPDNRSSHWYPFLFDGQTGAEINGNIITLYFVDGARGDDDLEENGTIIDIGGPGIKEVFSIQEEKSGGCFISGLKN